MEEGISSFGSLEAIISNIGRRTTHVEVLMPHRVLSKKNMMVNLQRGEFSSEFIRACLQIVGCEPSDAEVLEHLNL